MPWMQERAMDQRLRLVLAWEAGEEAVAELCRRAGISRRIAYKWRKRYRAEGPAGLADRSRAPHTCPHRMAAEREAALLGVRAAHPTWGPRKLRAFLGRQEPEADWPAPSTIGALLQRRGLSHARKYRRHVPPGAQPFGACTGPNQVWCTDFKGWFRTGDGQRCDPWTLTDAASRFLLRVQAVEHTGAAFVWPWLEAAFREYGLPEAIRSDNGPPFASRGIAGLSVLSVRWLRLGIRPERITPGSPQENGRHERMHRTLAEETACPPAATARRQQACFDAFRYTFNQERPHEALQQQTPAAVYRPSPRRYPAKLAEPTYPAGLALRRVGVHGEFYWQGRQVFLGEALRGQLIALAAVDERYFQVGFTTWELGILDGHRGHMLRPRVAAKLEPVMAARRSGEPFRCASGFAAPPA